MHKEDQPWRANIVQDLGISKTICRHIRAQQAGMETATAMANASAANVYRRDVVFIVALVPVIMNALLMKIARNP